MPTLEWIGKEKAINHHQDVPFRVLERKYSYDENGQHDEDNGSENMIIRGDNLEALKALLPKFDGQVKCIYIDTPYNTGNDDKKVYQEFSNAIMSCLSCFKESRIFVTDTKEFKDNIYAVIRRNCFENIVQNPNDLVSIIVKGNYKFYTQREIPCDVVTAFEKWYNSLSEDWQRLVLNNIIAKLSVVKIEYADDELPF